MLGKLCTSLIVSKDALKLGEIEYIVDLMRSLLEYRIYNNYNTKEPTLSVPTLSFL